MKYGQRNSEANSILVSDLIHKQNMAQQIQVLLNFENYSSLIKLLMSTTAYVGPKVMPEFSFEFLRPTCTWVIFFTLCYTTGYRGLKCTYKS